PRPIGRRVLGQRHAGHDADVWIVKRRYAGRQPAGRGNTVRVGVREDLAAGELSAYIAHTPHASLDALDAHRHAALRGPPDARLGRAVRRPVVQYEDVVPRILLGKKTIEAAQHALAAVLDRHGDRDVGR